ncbi:hypothetical protein HD806DRAFT_528741 [Xylariaceae sp. AK1471]|nr:hypothetical protein HD806DRAFT_528741 [Xylariaceae sp. AK1471]
MPDFSELVALVEEDGIPDEQQSSSTLHQQQIDSLINVPIFGSKAYDFVKSTLRPNCSMSELMPQYGLLGVRQDSLDSGIPLEDRLILANMNMPWSAFICGSQGSGKSHTLSCLLESALLTNNPAGKLSHPLAGMALHYDNYSNYESTQVCEAAYLCSSGIPVTVLVSPSNIWTMKRLYSDLPGLQPGCTQPRVVPLYIQEDQLNVSRILKLMAVNPTAKECPLYMQVVMKVAREMAMEGPGFTYTKFRQRLANIVWAPGQSVPLNMRLDLMDSFIAPSETTKSTRPAQAHDIWAFKPGSLTIIDLSDPFVSSDDACTLFAICLSIFLEGRNKCGRVVVLDEAHKFLGQSGEARILTNDLTAIIRQQRHTGTRVLIATQEPTLSPELIDLANATFVHRFLSPAWHEILKKHLAGANRQHSGNGNPLFDTIVALRTGEALLFCPTAHVDIDESPDGCKKARPLGNSFAKLRIRRRLTADGGRSIMATDNLTGITAETTIDHVPMYIVSPKSKSSTAKNIGYKPSTGGMPSSSGSGALNDGHSKPAMSVDNTSSITITPQQNQMSAGAKHQAAISTSKSPKDSCAKDDKHQGSTTAVPNNSNNERSPSKVHPVLKPSAAPKTSNISPPNPLVNKSIKEQFLAEVRRQANTIMQARSSSVTSHLPASQKAQKSKMYSDVEASLQLPPGTLAKEGPLKANFWTCLNKQLELLDKQAKSQK